MKKFLCLLFCLATLPLFGQPGTGPYPTSGSSSGGGGSIVGSEIYVYTNDINGLNVALSLAAVSTNKMSAGGGLFRFQHGTHYLTTAFLYTNTFPAAITFDGEVKPGVSLVYVGPSTNANIFRFMGNQVGEGCLLQVRLKGIEFSSIYDNTNWLVQIQGAAHAEIEGCQFMPWVIATNNSTRGIAVAEAEVSTRYTNLSGLYLGPGDTGIGLSVRDCGFQWLQNGLYDGTDHILVENCFFSLIGGGPSGSAINTGWATNSMFRLGAAIIRDSTPGNIGQTLYSFCHFTLDNIMLLNNDSAMVNKAMEFCRLENCTYRYVSLKSGNGFTLYSCNNAASSSPDGLGGIVGVSYAISNATPSMRIMGEDDQIATGALVMYGARSLGFKVDGNGNSQLTGTNTTRSFVQYANLDLMTLTVTGASEGRVNGTYRFQTQDQRNLNRDNWRTVWTNTVGTNTIVFDPTGGIAWGAYDITNDIDNVLYFSENTAYDPPPTTWDQNAGGSPTITVAATYGKFSADPNGNISGLSGVLRSNLNVAGVTYLSNGLAINSGGITNLGQNYYGGSALLTGSLQAFGVTTFSNTVIIGSNAPGNLPGVNGGSGELWNSNADLYWVSTAPFGSTRTTNLIKAH